MNKIEGIIDRLRYIYAKDGYTVKDIVLLKTCISAGEDAALALELSWDFVFEEIEEVIGAKLDEVSLISVLRQGGRRGPREKMVDLMVKFALYAPLELVKTEERKKRICEYVAKVEIKDRRNPHYKRALRNARTIASTYVKRAYEAVFPRDPAFERIYRSIADVIDRELAKPNTQNQERQFRQFLRKIASAEARLGHSQLREAALLH